jgi:hypothetical protein
MSFFSSILNEDSIGGCSFHISKNVAAQFGEETSTAFLKCSKIETVDGFFQQLANFAEK